MSVGARGFSVTPGPGGGGTGWGIRSHLKNKASDPRSPLPRYGVVVVEVEALLVAVFS